MTKVQMEWHKRPVSKFHMKSLLAVGKMENQTVFAKTNALGEFSVSATASSATASSATATYQKTLLKVK